MPIFYLRPAAAHLDHAAWSSCTFRGECWVNAKDEGTARGIASGKFQNGGATIPGVSETPSPWRNIDLVAVLEVPAGPSGMRIPENTVVADH